MPSIHTETGNATKTSSYAKTYILIPNRWLARFASTNIYRVKIFEESIGFL